MRWMRRSRDTILALGVAMLLAGSCTGMFENHPGSDGDADSDSDSDSDTDIDADSDRDIDTEHDTDTDDVFDSGPDVGIDTDPEEVEDSEPDVDPDTPPPDPCDECLSFQCEDHRAACESNPQCIAMWECSAACALGDIDCFDDCDRAHPTGLLDYYELTDCIYWRCGIVCEDPCALCERDRCSHTLERCLSNPECAAYWDCDWSCPIEDHACRDTCATIHEAGLDDYFRHSDCLGFNCAYECGYS